MQMTDLSESSPLKRWRLIYTGRPAIWFRKSPKFSDKSRETLPYGAIVSGREVKGETVAPWGEEFEAVHWVKVDHEMYVPNVMTKGSPWLQVLVLMCLCSAVSLHHTFLKRALSPFDNSSRSHPSLYAFRI